MSRSYKKTPCASDHSGKFLKKIYNRIFRRNKFDDTPRKGNIYQKVNDSYNICDYKDFSTFQQYWDYKYQHWLLRTIANPDEPMPNKRKCYYEWLKSYKSK